MSSINRREFVSCAGAALAVAPGLAVAAAPVERRLIVIVMRGALDGLSAVAPYAEPSYRDLRRNLGMTPADGLIDLDGAFGLHPGLAELKPVYDAKELLFVHAVASPYRERSHFDAQSVLETGSGRDRRMSDGWLNRALAGFGRDDPEAALALSRLVPQILAGSRPVSNWAPSAGPEMDQAFLDSVADLYARDSALSSAFARGRETHRLADALDPSDQRRGGSFVALASKAAELMTAGHGPAVAVLEIGGWDTHAGQQGRLPPRLSELSKGILALKEGLGALWPQTAILAVTEFGRTVRENGTGGTDHGTASVAILAGGCIRGGRVAGSWPGIDRLYEDRDLMPTSDVRQIFKAALAEHMGLPPRFLEDKVFPDSLEMRPMSGLFRTEHLT